MKQTPRRTCVGCRTTRAQPELVRIAATPEGVAVDPDQRMSGRGAYVCPDPRCLDRLERAGGHTLRRALRTEHSTTVALSELHRRLEDSTAPTPRAGDDPAATTAPAGPAVTGPPPPRSSTA